MTKLTYNNYNHLIPNWFIAFLLLFTIGGYTNYTQPLAPKEAVELVVAAEENTKKTVSYQKALRRTQYSENNNLYTSLFSLISEHHGMLAAIKDKGFNTTISLFIIHKTISFRPVAYSSEEASFS